MICQGVSGFGVLLDLTFIGYRTTMSLRNYGTIKKCAEVRMMKLFLGPALLGCMILLRIWPGLLTLALLHDFRVEAKKKSKKGGVLIRLITAAACGLNFAFYVLIHRLFVKRWNFLRTAEEIRRFRFSYQDIGNLPFSFLVCTAMGVALGFGLRRMLSGIFGEREGRPLSVRCKAFLFLSLSVISLASMGSAVISMSGFSHIVINEVYAGGRRILLGDGREISDYVELYNKGSLSCELDHIYLSDNENVLKKTELSSCEVPAGGYVLVVLEQSGAFALKAEGGEAVILSDSVGNVLDRVETPVFSPGFSYARQRDGAPEWGPLTCTPEMTNTAGFHQVAQPVLSHKSGFYTEPFELEISSEPGTTVYYTTDGSVPAADALSYTGPIHVYDRSTEANVYRSVRNVTRDWLHYEPEEAPVGKAYILRAVAVSGDGSVSEPVTATYFVDMDSYRQSTVISLVADPALLWGEDGIYVTGRDYDVWYLNGQAGEEPVRNYNRRGRDYEKEVFLEYFSEELTFSQNAGLRITGASNREDPMKNFTLYARKEYGGSDSFDEPIFPGVSSHKLTLRQGHANTFCQTLVRGRDIATQDYRCVSVFLNGEFWYNTSLLEKYDAGYFEERYGIDRSNIVVNNQGGIGEGTEEDLALRREIDAFLDTHDLADWSAYAEFGSLVDMQSYIDFICANVYMDNMDFSESGNVIMWRSRDTGGGEYEDERWRWALYDLDAAGWNDHVYWGIDTQQEKNSFSLQPKFVEQPVNQQPMFQALKRNPDFCRQFVLTFMDLANSNFSYENVESKIEEYDRNLQASGGGARIDWDREYFEDFYENRAGYITAYLGGEFGLSGSLEQIRLSVSDPAGGTVLLNTIRPDLSSGSWSGMYYTDYPVTAEACPAPGYVFAGWEGETDSQESRIRIPVREGGISLRAVFREDS